MDICNQPNVLLEVKLKDRECSTMLFGQGHGPACSDGEMAVGMRKSKCHLAHRESPIKSRETELENTRKRRKANA